MKGNQMAGLGRIKRDKQKIAKMAWKTAAKGGADHSMNVRVSVGRNISNNDYPPINRVRYSAKACIVAHAKWPQDRKRIDPTCGFGAGRNPQSAIAIALKRLSFKVAKRGRRGKR